ncbi:MAG: hypothetical protein GY699_13320 [Desulfobacteraceae bacterium]|nr:hypothetical protein [Desulfobacteraceae bacterium]
MAGCIWLTFSYAKKFTHFNIKERPVNILPQITLQSNSCGPLMMPIDLLKGIWGISLCSWGLFGLYISIRIERFIVKRYEKETGLTQTLYFSELMPFARYLPNFFSSPLYIGHLLSFVWGWKFVKFIKEKRRKVKYYDDIDSPEDVTRYFSIKEIRRVKRFAIIGFIVITHAIAYYILKFIWPEAFG